MSKNENKTENTTQESTTPETVGQTTEALPHKTCFFVTPLGDDNSLTRRATDGLIEAVLIPVVEGVHKMQLIPPHRIDKPGSITKQIIRHLLDSDLVIANLTELNPNVMYELAVRHAKRLPIIVIAQKGTVLPFDIKTQRTIFYDNDMTGVVALKNDLLRTIPEALADENPDNPIYDGLDSLLIREKIENENNNVQKYLFEQVERIGNMVQNLTSRINNNEFTLSDFTSKIASNVESFNKLKFFGFVITFPSPFSIDTFRSVEKILLDEGFQSVSLIGDDKLILETRSQFSKNSLETILIRAGLNPQNTRISPYFV